MDTFAVLLISVYIIIIDNLSTSCTIITLYVNSIFVCIRRLYWKEKKTANLNNPYLH